MYMAEEAGGAMATFNASKTFDSIVHFLTCNYAPVTLGEVLFSPDEYVACLKVSAAAVCGELLAQRSTLASSQDWVQ